MTKRGLIAAALETELKKIKPSNGYQTNLYESVVKRFIFADEDPELPLVSFSTGTESIRYLPGGTQDRFLAVNLRCYVSNEDDPQTELEKLIQDIELVIERSARLALSDGSTVRDIKINLIDTDQGVLAPLGLAEIQLVVEY